MQWTIDAAGARDLDRRITESGVEEFCLMMRASKAATDHLLRSKPTSVVCLAGSGNNGGDAYGCRLFAPVRHAHDSGRLS